jgi:Ubiquitin family
VVREETETGFPVTIKTPSDSIEVSVEEDDTVLHLKQKIAKKNVLCGVDHLVAGSKVYLVRAG